MSLTYATWVAELALLCEIDSNDANFQANLPSATDYAEQRMYRELDLLNTVTRQTGTLTPSNRTFNLPTAAGRFVVTNGFNVITPAGQANPDGGKRNQLVATSRDVLDMLWPDTSVTGVPTLYAMITDQQIIVGPAPDQGYTLECIGTIRPAPLSATNTTTYLSLYLPDAFLAASMVFMAGYMQNFGAQSDNPQMAQSWESQYTKLFASANVEELRKKYAAGAWSSMQPAPTATPSR